MSKVKGVDDVPLGQPLRMRLAQKGLKNAELVIWAMSKQSGEGFVDVRLWFSTEIAGQWMPSKKGVRVPIAALPALQKLLDYKSGELLLTDTANRELWGRWMEDNSGRAFDLRYFLKTTSYTGWDKRGVRLRLEDCPRLLMQLASADDLAHSAKVPESGGTVCLEIRSAQDLLDAVLG